MKLIKLTLILSFLALSACVGLPTTAPAPKLVVNAQGVPSHYQVKKGDTVSKIATRYGLNWREVASLNNLDDKYTIRQGQWLALWQTSATNTKRKAITAPVTQPLIIQNIVPVPQSQPQSQLQFVYPVPKNSVIVRHFGATNNANVKSEGVWFRSEENAPVVAIADGRVIFVDESSANGVFVNIRHADGMIGEYRFVKQLKVEPNQMVRAGQQIASAKKANSGSVITEFRLSKHGVYIDPMTVLK